MKVLQTLYMICYIDILINVSALEINYFLKRVNEEMFLSNLPIYSCVKYLAEIFKMMAKLLKKKFYGFNTFEIYIHK